MDKTEFYLKSAQLCKKLEPIMAKLNIEPDGYWKTSTEHEWDNDYRDLLTTAVPGKKVKTYRKDSLEAALPKWCFDWLAYQVTETDEISNIWYNKGIEYSDEHAEEVVSEIRSLLRPISFGTGPNTLTALANLIILLDSEGLTAQ